MTEPRLCACGCGQTTPIATRSRTARGHVAGQPVPLVPGHRPGYPVPNVRPDLPSPPAAAAGPADLTEFLLLARPKKPACKVGFALSQLGPVDVNNVQAALATDPGIIPAGAITAWLAARGHETSAVAVAAHRSGKCTCAYT